MHAAQTAKTSMIFATLQQVVSSREPFPVSRGADISASLKALKAFQALRLVSEVVAPAPSSGWARALALGTSPHQGVGTGMSSTSRSACPALLRNLSGSRLSWALALAPCDAAFARGPLAAGRQLEEDAAAASPGRLLLPCDAGHSILGWRGVGLLSYPLLESR